jgi:hypothetical protein
MPLNPSFFFFFVIFIETFQTKGKDHKEINKRRKGGESLGNK